MSPDRAPLPLALDAPEPGSVLVLAPHPDNEVIGCGGTLCLHTDQGDRVHVLMRGVLLAELKRTEAAYADSLAAK